MIGAIFSCPGFRIIPGMLLVLSKAKGDKNHSRRDDDQFSVRPAGTYSKIRSVTKQ